MRNATRWKLLAFACLAWPGMAGATGLPSDCFPDPFPSPPYPRPCDPRDPWPWLEGAPPIAFSSWTYSGAIDTEKQTFTGTVGSHDTTVGATINGAGEITGGQISNESGGTSATLSVNAGQPEVEIQHSDGDFSGGVKAGPDGVHLEFGGTF